jgi:type I restriction enzyme S subunit
MSEWKTYTLGKDVVTKLGDGLHGTPNYDENGEYYFINGSNLVNGKIVINSNTKKVTEEEFIKYKKDLSDKTILLGINGTIGNVALYNNEMCVLGKSAAYLNINDDFDKQFVRYVLTNNHFQTYIKNNASGTTIKNVGLGLLREYEFSAPKDKAEQQQIAQILTSLDDKIELNLQMNQTLEAMAQAIFKEWFVDFNFPNFDGELVAGLPKGWKECTMRDFGKIVCGKTPSKAVDEYFGGEYMFIKIPDMHNSVFIIETSDSLTELGLNSQSNKTIPPYSICISSIATVGLVCINPKPCQTNQQINTIVPKNDFLKYYLYFLAISMKETFLATASGGTATLNMNTSQFSNLSSIMPSDDILKRFDEIVSPMLTKILENNYCNQALINTRDTLLPKLMSGKIEVKKLR